MKKILLVLFLVVLTVGAEVINVHIMSGQSNMSGYGKFHKSEEYESQPEVDESIAYYYHIDPTTRNWTTTSFENLKEFYDKAVLSGYVRKFGCEVAYGRALAEYDDTGSVAIIKVSQGSSTLAVDWNSRSGAENMWSVWKREVSAALTELTDGGNEVNIASIIWLQGENDSKVEDYANAYRINFSNMVDDMFDHISSAGYDTDDALFMTASFSEHKDNLLYRDIVSSAQIEVMESQDNYFYVDTRDISQVGTFPELFITDENIHWDGEGQKIIGERLSRKYLSKKKVTF